MKHRATLIAIPLLVAAAYLGLQSRFQEPEARRLFFVAEIATMKLLAVAGCLIAATRFRPREYLAVAWYLIGLNYVLLFAKDLTFGRALHLPAIDPELAATLRALFVILANLAASAGAIMLARVWYVAGIALPGSRPLQYVAMLSGGAVAVGLVGWGTLHDLHNLAHDREAVIALASNLGDVVSLGAIAPILLTAIAMRGGALAWPWALVTLSNVCWLLYDMSWSFERQWAFGEPMLRIIAELWRAAACALALAAGLAQRWAIRSAPRDHSAAGGG